MRTAWWILLLTLFVRMENAAAQFVSIPDPGFVDYLQDHGFIDPSNGPLLDTTSVSILSAELISCSGYNIQDLTGLQYFKNLKNLNCDQNDIALIPALPDSLEILYCPNNQISQLPNLPLTLKALNIAYNPLVTFPLLHEGIENLYCNQLQLIDSLPALPNTIKILNCSGLSLSTLPSLPNALEMLNCGGDSLTSLPELPVSLKELYCEHNQITELPALPDSLLVLSCSYNQLTELPALPQTLAWLYCADNLLTALPSLPLTLDRLICDGNQLTELPQLPPVMFQLMIGWNSGLQCLPPLQKFTGNASAINFSVTGITCLPNVIQTDYSIPLLDAMPICGLINLNGCEIGWNILGKTFNDTNGDCLETVEDNLKNIKVSIFRNDTLLQQFITTNSGLFSFQVPFDTYELEIDTSYLPFNVLCPTDNIHTSILDATNLTDSAANFALQCKPGFDVGVNNLVETFGAFFPANTATVEIHAGDITSFYGTTCNTSGIPGTVTASANGLVTINSASSGGLVSGNQITWNVTDLSNVDFENDFWLQLTTDPSAQAGDLVCVTVAVSASAGTDNNALNDTLTHCFTVVNSYDPNVKEAYPATVSQPGDWHTYTVHFQNTGTAAAQNIVVKDTLDANLDWSSFQLLAYSHENLTQVLQNGIVHFNFPNINLPDSNSNEPDSHGFIQYKIKTDSTLTFGTEIHNTAAIYFDFNEPVITNDALVVYEEPENNSTTFHSTSAFTLYPNPANDNITIQRTSSTKALIQLTDLTGKVLFNIQTEQKQTNLSLESLSAGAYLIRISENERPIGVKKLAIVR